MMRLNTSVATLLAFGLSSLGSFNVVVPATIAATTSLRSACEPIGLILSIDGKAQADRTYQDSLICADQSLQTPRLPRKATIEFLCYSNGQTRTLSHLDANSILASCPVAIRPCDEKGGLCSPPKGTRRGSLKVVVITPYEKVLPGKPVTFSWEPVTGVNSYTITLQDETTATSIMEERVENSTSLQYPRGIQDQLLQAGHTYTLQVEADKPGSQPGKAIFDVLTDQEAGDVLKKVTYLQQLGSTLPLDQRERLVYEALDAVYTNYGLLDEAIASLTQLVEAGTQTPQIYRILGDRYVQVGQLELALQQYEKAVHLAEKAGDTPELAIAQKRLSALKALIQQLQQEE